MDVWRPEEIRPHQVWPLNDPILLLHRHRMMNQDFHDLQFECAWTSCHCPKIWLTLKFLDRRNLGHLSYTLYYKQISLKLVARKIFLSRSQVG
jgi:hypothetical protein